MAINQTQVGVLDGNFKVYSGNAIMLNTNTAMNAGEDYKFGGATGRDITINRKEWNRAPMKCMI